MNIARMHAEIKLRFNKLNSNFKQDLPPAYIDDILNSVIFYYVENFYHGNASSLKYKIGVEVTQQRIDMFANLVESPDQPLTVLSENTTLNRYTFDLAELQPPYMHMLRVFAITDCGVVNFKPSQHDDINVTLNDKLTKPSRGWKRGVYKLVSSPTNSQKSAIQVYTAGEYTISDLYIEYIRCPRKVFYGKYDTLEYKNGDETAPNKNSEPIDSDISDKYHDVIVDMAVQELARILGDANQYNTREDRILTATQ